MQLLSLSSADHSCKPTVVSEMVSRWPAAGCLAAAADSQLHESMESSIILLTKVCHDVLLSIACTLCRAASSAFAAPTVSLPG
jgi:hypothetical protein